MTALRKSLAFTQQLNSDITGGLLDKDHATHIRFHIEQLRQLEITGTAAQQHVMVQQIEQDFVTAHEVARVYGRIYGS